MKKSRYGTVRGKVLIVDDNDVTRELLRTIVRREQYNIVGEALNGTAALEAMKRLAPTIVLLDLVMPEMDGFEVLREIRASYPATAVIVVTAHTSAENIRAVLDAGAAGVVVKPFKPAQVVESLARLVSSPPIQVQPQY